MSDFHGQPVLHLSSEYLELDCLAEAGPRIVRLRYKGSDNLLADVPELSVPTANGPYRFWGGHRLWFAPESMPRSYIPDADGLVASQLPDGVALQGKPEPIAGIRKRVEIRLDRSQPRVVLTHTLTNEGLWEVELAPWALTMMRLGGTAILPNRPEAQAANELLPNRHYSLWRYSHIDDPRLTLHDDFIVVRAMEDMAPFKIGTFNAAGWLAYWSGGVLFRKSYEVHPGLPYPDHDCNAEVYCDKYVIELESLAPLTRLAPGASVSHTETWQLYDSLEQDFLSDKMVELVRKS